MIFFRLENSSKTEVARVSDARKNAENFHSTDRFHKRKPDFSRTTNDRMGVDLEPNHRDNRKPKIIKREIGKIGVKRRSSDEGDNDIPAKISRTASKVRMDASSVKSKQRKSIEVEPKDDDIFSDLEEIDLDIGVEVEDAPNAIPEKVCRLFC